MEIRNLKGEKLGEKDARKVFGDDSYWVIIRCDEVKWLAELKTFSVGDFSECIDVTTDKHFKDAKRFDLYRFKKKSEEEFILSKIDLKTATVKDVSREALYRYRMALDWMDKKGPYRGHPVVEGNSRKV